VGAVIPLQAEFFFNELVREALQLNLCVENVTSYYFCILCMQETSFFPLSAALLSSPIVHSASGPAAEILMGITSSIESIVLSLLFCRSGSTGIFPYQDLYFDFLKCDRTIIFCSFPGISFLLSQPEATELIVLSLQDAENMNKTECITLRQAFVLLSKGFFCRPQEVGMIMELHLKVVCASSFFKLTWHL
jgi:hypothetical protein